MRKIILALLIVMFMTVAAVAEETSRGNYTTPSPWLTELLNENDCIYHSHSYTDKQRAAVDAGAGLDLLLYKWEDAKWLSEVNLELRKDFVDIERFSGYLVLKVDVSSIFNFLK